MPPDSSPPVDPKELLREGIAAAKLGQHERARELLTRLVEQDERNVTAWLWLSSVVHDLNEREICLENVLTLDPDNEAARRGLQKIRPHKPESLLQEGIAAARAGELARARDLLTRVVQQDDTNAEAWLWLSGVVDNAEEREACLENVLALDPDNEPATQGLLKIRQAKAALEEEAPPAAIYVPEKQPYAPENLSEPYQCPYCAALTDPKDKLCPSCRGELWVKNRRREETSSWYWIAITMLISTLVWYVVLLFQLFARVEVQLDLNNLLTLLKVYLGLTGGIPAGIVERVLAVEPRSTFIALTAGMIFTGGVLTGMLLRWTWIYFVFLANAVGSTTLAIVSALSGQGLATTLISGIGTIFPAIEFATAFRIWDDFAIDRERLLLRLDGDASSGFDLLARAQHYARKGMWALAALHLQRAEFKLPHHMKLDCLLNMATAYTSLEWYDQAHHYLQEARQIDPEDPRIEELATLLESMDRHGEVDETTGQP
jgi:tetratricopeptide (TPR) repeat protein